MSDLRTSPRERASITMVFVGHGLAFGTWAGCVPRLRELWALQPGPLGLVLLSLALGALAAMPIGGRLSARFGAPRVAVLGGFAFAALLAAPAAVHALALAQVAAWVALLASAGILGLAAGTMDIGMNSEASAAEPRAGRMIMSGLHGGWSLGGFLGAGIAAGGAALGVPLAGTLATAGVVMAALVCAATPTLWNRSRPIGRADRPASRDRVDMRALGALGVMAALCFTLEGALADWSGVFLRDVHAASATVASAAFSGVAFMMMLARFGGDAIRRWIGAVAMTRLGGLLAAAAMAAALLAASVPVAVAGFAVVGFGIANIVPVVFSAAGGRAGTGGIALVASVGYAGLLAGPPIIGFTAQVFSLTAALWLVVGGSLALTLLAGSVSASPAASASTRASGRVPSDART